MNQDQLRELRELIEFLKANGIAEFDMEHADLKVRLKFMGAAAPAMRDNAPPDLASPGPAEVAPSLRSSAPLSASGDPEAAAEEPLHTVKSPIVGTFYESPSPGAPAFVKAGDQVEVGQVLCIIEAMKLMNEIEADMAGEIVRRIASSGQPVEYGQPLFTIRPS